MVASKLILLLSILCSTKCNNLSQSPLPAAGPNSSVAIATLYRLGGRGIESRFGRDFPRLSVPSLRPTQPLVQWVKIKAQFTLEQASKGPEWE